MSRNTSVRMLIALMLLGVFCSYQCCLCPRQVSPPAPVAPQPARLTLEFEDLEEEYERGVVTLTLRVTNRGGTACTIAPWHNRLGPNNVMIYLRRRIEGKGVGQFTHLWDPERLTVVRGARQSLPAGSRRTFTVRTVLDVPPGKYQLMAYLKADKDVRTDNELIKIEWAEDEPKEEL